MNNARIALIALLMLQCLHSHAQKYSWYGAVTDSNRQVIYYTNFDKVDENNKDWEDRIEETHDSLFYAYIKDGTLEVTSHDDTSTSATGFSLSIDYFRDFEIEFSARLEKKYTDKISLVMWGRDSTNDIYNGQFFYFYQDVSYKMIFCSGKGSEPCDFERLHKQYGLDNNRGDYNTYNIRKIKDKYYVFVNKQYSHRYLYTPLHGQTIGFGTGPKSVANMDYIKVSYLKLD